MRTTYGQNQGRREKLLAHEGPVCRGHMTSAEREAITGVWGRSLQQDPQAQPLVRESRGEASLKLKGLQHRNVQKKWQFRPFLGVFGT